MEIANLLSTCKGMQQDVEGTFPIAVEILLKPNNENHRQETYSPSKKKKSDTPMLDLKMAEMM